MTYFRNPDLKEAELKIDDKVVLKFAVANGFKNIQNLVRKLKRGQCSYDYVEVMACPSGNYFTLQSYFFNEID